MSEEIKYDRRRFLAIAAMSVAAAEFGMTGAARRTVEQAKPAGHVREQAGKEHLIRLTKADRCRRFECRLRRGRPQ